MVSPCLIGFVLVAFFNVVQSEKIKDILVTFSNCDEDSLIRFDKGFSMYVDSEYRARIRGCISANSFEEAEVFVKVKNYELSPWDICNKPDKRGPQFDLIRMLHDALELDFDCPFEKMRNCMDGIVDLRRYRRYLKLLPKFNDILLNFKHNDGKISCIAVKTNSNDHEEIQE